MKPSKNKIEGFTLTEFLILLAILAVIGSVIARIIYQKEIQKWGDSLCHNLGIEPFWPNIIIAVVALIYIVKTSFLNNIKRNNKRRNKLKLR